MYQALYRKWRPRTFADVIGQSHITQTLQKQVAEGRTSHAYLFTGTRGTGKTTCAKILAKAVNCESPVNGDPCCKCPSCLGIESGTLLDVLELDAASNNGVDQVRALRDEAIYAPANVRTRVYIVDEVHMLSIAAFNALLKILEEPPAHLMFILATTELHKVPATILSRCQRFSFKRIQPPDIQSRLEHVAFQEKIDLKSDGAELLSRLSDGALRDALSLLDQCAASGGTIDAAAVLDTLGLAGNLQTAQMMEHVLNRDVESALLLLDQLYSGGKDVGAILSELSTLTRDLLLRRTAPKGCTALLSGGYDKATLDRLGKDVPSTRFLYLTATLQKTAADLYYSANRRTDAELCLLRLCDESLSGDLTGLNARMQRLEESISRGAVVRAAAEEGLLSPAGAEKVRALGNIDSAVIDAWASGEGYDNIGEDEGDRELARELSLALFERSARCMCTNLLALSLLMDAGREKPVCVLAEGSLVQRGRHYRPVLERLLRECGETLGISIELHVGNDTTQPGSAAAALLNLK